MSPQEDIKFNSFINIKIQALVEYIMQHKSLVFTDALDFLYYSETYRLLINEKDKVWHLSTPKLYEILNNEHLKNEVILPDYV